MIIVGIDEAGRGCWAGPLVAAAVVLKRPIAELTDSKALSRIKRESLDIAIRSQAVGFGLGWCTAEEIDDIGLTAATSKAMAAALSQVACAYDRIVIDGNYNYLPNHGQSTWQIKADATVPAVSAASVLAKVARDKYMHELANQYPQYKFEQHVGYGTALHTQMLLRYGVSEQHRKSYKPIQKILAVNND